MRARPLCTASLTSATLGSTVDRHGKTASIGRGRPRITREESMVLYLRLRATPERPAP
jgi:hypothetical protein